MPKTAAERLRDKFTRHNTDLRPNMAMFPNPNGVEGDSVIGVLRRVFLVKYPMLQRRYDWLSAKRSTNEDLGSWYSRFKQAGVEANLHDVTRDKLMILGIVVNVGDRTLASRILRSEDDSLQAAERLPHLHGHPQAIRPCPCGLLRQDHELQRVQSPGTHPALLP